MYKLDIEKAEEPEINICWIIENIENICFTDYTKAYDCVDHNKQWKILKEMGIPDHLTCGGSDKPVSGSRSNS